MTFVIKRCVDLVRSSIDAGATLQHIRDTVPRWQYEAIVRALKQEELKSY